MWNIKKGTNEFFLIGQKEIHRCRKQTYGYQKGIQEIKVFSHWHKNSTFNDCTCFSLWNLSVGLFFETENMSL